MTIPQSAGRDLRTLRYVEHLTVWLLRTSVACCANCRLIHREFAHAFGPRAEEAEGVFQRVLRALSCGVRPITIGRPGHIEITHDEQSLINMFAAAQGLDEARFRAHACWLMGHGRVDALYAATRDLSEILHQRGHEFRAATTDGSFAIADANRCEVPDLRVLHS